MCSNDHQSSKIDEKSDKSSVEIEVIEKRPKFDLRCGWEGFREEECLIEKFTELATKAYDSEAAKQWKKRRGVI